MPRTSSRAGYPRTARRGTADPLRIRRYRPGDRAFYARSIERLQDHLRALDRTGMVQRPPGFGARYARVALPLIRRYHGRILIAERDGRPVGFVAAYVRPRNRMRDLELRPGRHGFVMDLYVAPSVRGQGIGTALLRAAEGFLAERGCVRLFLDVFAPNGRAHSLYRRLGYTDFGILMTAAVARPRATDRSRRYSGRSSK